MRTPRKRILYVPYLKKIYAKEGTTFCLDTVPSNLNKDENIDPIFGQDGRIIELVKKLSLNQNRFILIPKDRAGLNIMYTVNTFGNINMMANINKVQRTMGIVLNSVNTIVNKMGTIGGCGRVWYHPEAIANLLLINTV